MAAYRPLMVTRQAPPRFPTDDLALDAPPVPPSSGAGPARLLPIAVLIGVLGSGAVLWSSRSGGGISPMMLMLPGITLLSTLGMVLQGGGRGEAHRLDEQRRRYLDHLTAASREMRDAAESQRHSLTWTHPAPAALWRLIGGPRRWERSVTDSDFGHVRIGLATQRMCRAITVPPTARVTDLDPVTADALRRFVHTHSTLDDLPIALALCANPGVALAGPAADVRALVRSMVCQLAVSHGPQALLIAAVVGPGCREFWDWLKWLPHNRHPVQGGPMVYDSDVPIDDVLDAPGRPHLVLVIDGAQPDAVARQSVSVLVVGTTLVDSVLPLDLGADGYLASGGDRFARADGLSLPEARVCARRLARYGAAAPGSDDIARWHAATAEGWVARSGAGRLTAPLGVSADGAMVDLDIKEAAEGGQGPHGLCIGATGSGKSELLRTVVLGMVARHAPDDLNLVLVDFKGGATFLGLRGLNHIAAVITNLADEAQLVARTRDALAGEVHRRQQMLRRAGNAVNLNAYHTLRTRDADLPALPSLFVIVDEFAELLHQHPDFAEVFTMIGRVGRSLGMHLLLASQRLDEGRLRGLESHLSYRICLKTSTATDSRAVLGVPDAAELPTHPGAAYLRGADGRLIRFQTTYLGAPAPVAAESCSAVELFTSQPAPAAPPRGHRTLLDDMVDRFTGQGSPAHQIWLPPLPRSPLLSELPKTTDAELCVAIGLVDRPFEQRRTPLLVDVGGAGGNVAVVGAPRSGKSQTVRTLIAVLADSHDARRIQFYCLDFGGSTLAGLCALAHVGSVATRAEPELVRRIVGHVDGILRSREAGAADEYGDVVLVVDGWQVLREEFADLEPVITAVAAQGLSFGIHLVLTAGRWADLRPVLKDQIGTRIELRLGDPLDSDVDRKQAALVPAGRPGRGVSADGHHFTIATSTIPGRPGRQSWRAPAVRLLPGRIERSTLLERAEPEGIVLGIAEPDLTPLVVDFARQPHLLVVGDPECGKTATLRALCLEIVRHTTPHGAELFVVDYRRTLLGVVDPAHLREYVFSPAGVVTGLAALADSLRLRLPPPGATVEQLRTRSWWSGPEMYVVVDDYDVVAAVSGDVLAPLLELLPHATDVGLHLIIARRSAGLSRALYDPLLTQLRESGCMTLMMSGSPEEGAVIGGHRATPQPPGRGLLATRDGARRVQVGWSPP